MDNPWQISINNRVPCEEWCGSILYNINLTDIYLINMILFHGNLQLILVLNNKLNIGIGY